jgi:hypothetical protein
MVFGFPRNISHHAVSQHRTTSGSSFVDVSFHFNIIIIFWLCSHLSWFVVVVF